MKETWSSWASQPGSLLSNPIQQVIEAHLSEFLPTGGKFNWGHTHPLSASQTVPKMIGYCAKDWAKTNENQIFLHNVTTKELEMGKAEYSAVSGRDFYNGKTLLTKTETPPAAPLGYTNMLIGLQGGSGATAAQIVPLADAPEGGVCKP